MSGFPLTDQALDTVFRTARTANGWLDKPVPDDLLRQAYDLAKMGPTSANGSPLRIVFVKTPEAKDKIKPYLMEANVPKVMTAPVTAIFAQDIQFYDHLPFLFPHAPDARNWFAGNDALIAETAMRNSSLQAAYFMLAARSIGLDCGPMSGFDQKGVNDTFFPDGRFKANFICAIGYADDTKTFARGPRFNFDDVCKFA